MDRSRRHDETPATCLVDGHVHFYPVFDPDVGLDAAAGHVRRGAALWKLGEDTTGVLLLARSRIEPRFEVVAEQLGAARRWSAAMCDDGLSIRCRRTTDGARLLVIGGSQVRAAQGLEVLCLASPCEVPDGEPLEVTVRRAQEADAVTVIPWGFGKWTGRRRRSVERALDLSSDAPLFLGDNAGRPSFVPRPGLFREAEARGIPVLPGSDPLPRAGRERTMGRFGFLLDGLDESDPSGSLRRALFALDSQPPTFGGREGLLGTLLMQSFMQARKLLDRGHLEEGGPW